MKDINIGVVILENRKLKGITQDELANFIGVSKASVSKWETGQSYPDITFLPQLATYFNISMDELMGYQPQMTKKDIRNLYLKLSREFSKKPFETVAAQCQEIIKKYFACYPLLCQMGLLLLNNSNLAGDKSRMQEVVVAAKELFIKIKQESDDVELVKQAFQLEAVSLMMLELPHQVIALLGESHSLVSSSDTLLATAYQMTGNVEKAKETLQVEIYQYHFILLQLLQSYLSLFMDDEKQFAEIVRRFQGVADLFQIEKLKPDALLSYYLVVAQGYIVQGKPEKALGYLERFTKLATGDIYPLELKGDEFFNLVGNFFENLELGVYPPRDEKVIKQSMYDAVVNNPTFSILKEEPAFKNLVSKLEKLLEGKI